MGIEGLAWKLALKDGQENNRELFGPRMGMEKGQSLLDKNWIWRTKINDEWHWNWRIILESIIIIRLEFREDFAWINSWEIFDWICWTIFSI
jgi:hypothetical protein